MAKRLYLLLCVYVILKTGETCETVNGGYGTCISIYNCQPYLKLLQEQGLQSAQTLKRSYCGIDGKTPKVCCPSSQPKPSTKRPTVPIKLPPQDRVPALLNPPVCGLSNATFNRIVGGENAKLDDFPWMALLGYKGKKDNIFTCGGALISSRHVVTAAHCIYELEEFLYLVRLGELDLTRDDEGAHPIDVLIKHKIVHEQYNPNKIVNDIGLLALVKEVQFTDSIHPICIPKEAELRANNFEDYNPLVAGWGLVETGGKSADHLQVVQIPVVTNAECAEAYKALKALKVDGKVICAGLQAEGKDACGGDSGGPLMQPIWQQKENKAYFYLIGIVSFGKKCAQANTPGVYTRVTYFIPWIEEKITGHVTS